MSNLKDISVSLIAPGTKELRVDLDNDYHHAISITEGMTASQLAQRFHLLAENIKRQEFIEKKKEDNRREENLSELLRPFGDF